MREDKGRQRRLKRAEGRTVTHDSFKATQVGEQT